MNTVTAITDSSGAVQIRYQNEYFGKTDRCGVAVVGQAARIEVWFKELTKNTRIPGLSAGRNTLQEFFI